eukprot:6191121-Pleurochrysis_carterae.AAC.1
MPRLRREAPILVLQSTHGIASLVGINLGRSVRPPGVYHIWVPSSNRIVATSDAYFDELLCPWRPAHCTTPTRAEHVDADADQPPDLPNTETELLSPSRYASDPAMAAPAHLRQSTVTKPAKSSRRVLLLFSWPFERPDGIASFLLRFGLSADNIDNDDAQGGGGALTICSSTLCTNGSSNDLPTDITRRSSRHRRARRFRVCASSTTIPPSTGDRHPSATEIT